MTDGGALRTLLTLAGRPPRPDDGPAGRCDARGDPPAAAGLLGGTRDARARRAGPRIVTPDGPAELTVTGRVTNSGPVPVRDVGVRVQRGAAVSTDREIAAALAGAVSPDTGVAAPAFTPVGGELDPGDTSR